MDNTATIRIWNTIQMRLDEQTVAAAPIITNHRTHWLRWSFLVPAVATMVLALAVGRDGDVARQEANPTTIAQNAVTTQQNETMGPEGVESPLTAAVSARPQTPDRNPSTTTSVPRRIVASRGQSVFVAWGVSVYGPQNADPSAESDSRSLWAPSVY